MNPKLKTLISVIVGVIIGIMIMYLIPNYKIEKKSDVGSRKTEVKNVDLKLDENFEILDEKDYPIDKLTNETAVIDYVKSNHKLPDFYITKSEAKSKGWIPSKQNLCEILPGKAIGGDHFSNREKQLPKGEEYYEADVNYSCGNRYADRIIFTKNGDVWLTKNHYKTFEKK